MAVTAAAAAVDAVAENKKRNTVKSFAFCINYHRGFEKAGSAYGLLENSKRRDYNYPGKRSGDTFHYGSVFISKFSRDAQLPESAPAV